MGMTTAELNKALEKGEVMSDVFLPKFAKALRDTFTQADLERGMNSLNANMNRFSTSLFDMGKRIGQGGFNEGFSKIMSDMSKMLNDLMPLFEQLGNVLYFLTVPIRVVIRMISIIADVFKESKWAGSGLVLMIGLLIAKLLKLGGPLRMITGLFALLLSPVWLTIGAVLALGLIIDDLWTHFNGGKSMLGEFEWVQTLGEWFTTLKKSIQEVKDAFKDLDAGESVKKAGGIVGNAFVQGGLQTANQLEGVITDFGRGLGNSLGLEKADIPEGPDLSMSAIAGRLFTATRDFMAGTPAATPLGPEFLSNEVSNLDIPNIGNGPSGQNVPSSTSTSSVDNSISIDRIEVPVTNGGNPREITEAVTAGIEKYQRERVSFKRRPLEGN